MTFSLTWLPDVLIKAGLKVALVPGWEDRGIGDMGPVLGVLCHHTVGARTGNMPSLDVLIRGRKPTPTRKGLRGPLANLGLGRDGTYYVIAAGKAQHAGEGMWQGITTGNSSFIGIEAENAGDAADTWPDVQMDAYRRGVSAILQKTGRDVVFCAAHKEYAPSRKPNDPRFDMDQFRAGVAAILNGSAPQPVLIPRTDHRGRPTLRRGASGPAVDRVQQLLGVVGPDVFGPRTEAAVRQFQRGQGLVPDGIVGPQTWAVLEP